MSKDQANDLCPYCRSSLEIAIFRFSGVDMITVCPNCAIASAEECGSAGSKSLVKPNSEQMLFVAFGREL